MQYRIWDDMSLCTEADVQRMMSFVPKERCAYAQRYRHLFGQWTCLKAWEMVNQLAGIDVDWCIGEYGKPYVRGEIFFSVSHCRHGVAVVTDDEPVGIDIESIRSVNDSLICRTMNEYEQLLIRESNTPELAFIRLWTQKEALLKYRGTGIVDDLQSVLKEVKDVCIETKECLDKGYVYTIVTHNK